MHRRMIGVVLALVCGCGAGAAAIAERTTPREVTITRGDASVTICGTWDEYALAREGGAP